MVRESKQVRESIIEAYLVTQAKALGGEVRKVKWIGRRSAPDRLLMLPEIGNMRSVDQPARTIWVELKAPGKKPTAAQAREHKRMRDMGQRVEVVDSFKRVDEVLA